MPLPQHYASRGWRSLSAPRKLRVMIGSDGDWDTGKTEFIFSAPGPGILLAVDRNFEGALNNPNPPDTRRDDWAIKTVTVPMATTENMLGYLAYWKNLYTEIGNILNEATARSFGFDGDSDSWELQRLAAFGQLAQVPEYKYSEVNAARRALIAKMHDSNKVVISTNKVKVAYIDDVGPDGKVVIGGDGKPRRVKDPDGEVERQGFRDQNYLWQLQIRHLFKPSTTVTVGKREIKVPKQWGIRIMKCKPNKDLETEELWGSNCNFRSLVELVYPQIDPDDWYK